MDIQAYFPSKTATQLFSTNGTKPSILPAISVKLDLAETKLQQSKNLTIANAIRIAFRKLEKKYDSHFKFDLLAEIEDDQDPLENEDFRVFIIESKQSEKIVAYFLAERLLDVDEQLYGLSNFNIDYSIYTGDNAVLSTIANCHNWGCPILLEDYEFLRENLLDHATWKLGLEEKLPFEFRSNFL